MDAEIIIRDSFEELVPLLYTIWQKIATEAISRKGIFTVALSGGNTPFPFYEKLASNSDQIIWEKTHLFLVDERAVPPGHADHNFTKIRKALINKTELPPSNIHPIPTDRIQPTTSAKIYQIELEKFSDTDSSIISFDFTLLGVGRDGHTASLFPGTNVLNETKKIVATCTPHSTPHKRITMTLPLINNSRNIFFLLKGADKAEVARKIIHDQNTKLPASLVKPNHGNLIFLLDKAAASLL